MVNGRFGFVDSVKLIGLIVGYSGKSIVQIDPSS
jgi:hypothetical protein